MTQLQTMDKPLTKEELQKLDELLHSDAAFERMLERAVRGRRGAGRRSRDPAGAAR
jgi:hypothetical protein